MRKSIAIILTLICSIYYSVSVKADFYLESSTPARDAVMKSEVIEILLNFNTAIEQESHIEILHSNGLSVEPLNVKVSGKKMIATMKEPLENDEYIVLWSIVSNDGQIEEDSFRFVVQNPISPNDTTNEITTLKEEMENNKSTSLKKDLNETNQESIYISVFKEHKEGFILLTVIAFALLLISNRKSI